MQAAAVAGWLVGHYGATRGCGRRVLIAAAGLAAEAFSAAALWALVVASVIFVLGLATIVPAIIGLVGSRGRSSRAGALAVNGMVGLRRRLLRSARSPASDWLRWPEESCPSHPYDVAPREQRDAPGISLKLGRAEPPCSALRSCFGARRSSGIAGRGRVL